MDMINMLRKKQVATFSPEWEIAEPISQGGYQIEQWTKDISARDAYFLGKDRVSKLMIIIYFYKK